MSGLDLISGGDSALKATRCLVILLLLLGGGGLAAIPSALAGFENDLEIVWPSAPEPARVRFVGDVATPDDVKREKGFWTKVWEFIRGPEKEEMVKPMSVVADSKGRLIIADPAGKQIHIFDGEEGDYSLILDAGKETLELPIGVAVDGEDNFYVADGERVKIYLFDSQGEYQKSIGGPDVIQRPAAIAIDASRRLLYVADAPAHSVKVFGLDDGALRHTIGKRGRGHGEFNFPIYVAVDNEGTVYVTDAVNGRIQFFDPTGAFVGSFGQFGDGSGDFAAPKGVAVDSDGHIYVADSGFDNIQVFNRQGQLLLFFGSSGQAPSEFWMPAGLYMDAKDRLYVADSYNKRVQIFQYLKLGAVQ